MNLQERKKIQQLLYSWNWFYSNSKDSLMVSRYHKTVVHTKNDGDLIFDVSVDDQWNQHYGKAILHSSRAKNDRTMSSKIRAEINDNQAQIAKFYPAA